jgi:hypothetical protein
MNHMTYPYQPNAPWNEPNILRFFKRCPECKGEDLLTIGKSSGCRECDYVGYSYRFEAVEFETGKTRQI